MTKDRTRTHNKIYHNIFLYVTERCQLRCNHCYMGSRLESSIDMSFDRSIFIMDYFRKLGAEYITFVGGEPTLHSELPKMVDYASNSGYEKIYIDTNGLSIKRILNISPDKLAYIRISLDGIKAETHELNRGSGTFAKTIESIKILVENGYQVGITFTVFKFNIHEALKLLLLAEELGIKLVNYHVFSEEGRGVERINWSVSPYEWIDFYEQLELQKNNFNASIWFPPTWSSPEKIGQYLQEGYRGCLGCYIDRLSIFPNGESYICSVLFDEPIYYGKISEEGFSLNRNENEFEMFINAMLSAHEGWMSGCPAEKILEKHGKNKTPQNLISLCRCWKSQI